MAPDTGITKGCFFTGHRPDKLGGWNENNETANAVKKWLWKAIKRAIKGGHDVFISGAALGVDTWAAEAVHALKDEFPHIQLVLALPFSNQASVWRKEALIRWERLEKGLLFLAWRWHLVLRETSWQNTWGLMRRCSW